MLISVDLDRGLSKSSRCRSRNICASIAFRLSAFAEQCTFTWKWYLRAVRVFILVFIWYFSCLDCLFLDFFKEPILLELSKMHDHLVREFRRVNRVARLTGFSWVWSSLSLAGLRLFGRCNAAHNDSGLSWTLNSISFFSVSQ